MFLRASLLFTILFSAVAANASILVNAPDPYPQYAMGDSSIVIDYAGKKGVAQGVVVPTAATSFNSTKGYRYLNTIDTTTGNGLIYLDVSTDATNLTPTSTQQIAVSLKATGGNVITLTGASTASGSAAPNPCSSGGCLAAYDGAFYTPGTTLRLSFTVTALCNAGGTGSLCTGSTVQDTANTRFTQGIDVYFGVVNSSPAPTVNDVTGATTKINSSITLGITDQNPITPACSPPFSKYFFPGDGQIYLYPGNIGASDGSGSALQYLITMANLGTAVDFQNNGLAANTIVHYTPAASSMETITGFTNTTTGSDYQYGVVVQAQNRAGLVSTTPTECSLTGIQSQNISGILTESKCFIATAAYHDGRAAPVMMLRKFRDKILSRFSFGRDFIKTYYEYSPALAEWAWDKPLIRSFALKILAPIELVAWGILKIASAEETATQPYIDRVKKEISTDNAPAKEESYSEQEKKKLETNEQPSSTAPQPYIERLKKKLAEEEKPVGSSENYSEKEKTKLPANVDRESPITVVKEGRDHKLGLGEVPDIENAAGFKLGITPGMQVTVAKSVHKFTDVYGTGFQPELLFHFEHQLFHSENFGSFSLGVDSGFAYSGGKGLLQFGFGGSNQSITGFGFIQVPVLINATYRFNLLRLVRPYVSVGTGSILYTETRDDAKGDKRGYSFVYSGSAGASLLLDFLDSKTSRDGYLSSGIQHTYLFLEYLYLNTFKSTVMFNRAGIYSGFLFEF